MRRRAARSISPATATMTTAPRVAWGRSSNSGVRNSRVRTTTRAVVMPASWLRAPLSRLTAVWDSPPPAGKAWKQPPARLAAPRARSSWSASTRGSSGAAKARPAAIDSTNDIRAIPAAGATSSPARLRSGAASWGRPGGMAPTRATPRSVSPVAAASRIPRATTSSGPGSDGGAQRRSPSSMAMLARARTKVGQLRSPRLARAEPSLTKKSPSFWGTPRILPSWPAAISSPVPALKPPGRGRR
jgi:hypothetical protein